MKDNFEDLVDSIRIALYERTKNMNNNEVAQCVNDNARRIAEQFGMKIHGALSKQSADKAFGEE